MPASHYLVERARPRHTTTMTNLITLEGLDGSGKSTVWEQLTERYADTDVVLTREPTQNTWYGDAVYQSIRDDNANELAELFLYLADHANHLQETIQPALQNNTPVISDRYIDSRIAYQAATLADHSTLTEPASFIDNAHRPWSRYPDTTVYLDVSPEIGTKRSGSTNKFEQQDYLATVQDVYQYLRQLYQDRFETVNGEQSKTRVFDQVCDIVDPLVGYEQ